MEGPPRSARRTQPAGSSRRANSAVTAKWRWTCSHVADAAPEWPALLTTTTTATLMLRVDPSYPTVALFHVSLTLRKILKRGVQHRCVRSLSPIFQLYVAVSCVLSFAIHAAHMAPRWSLPARVTLPRPRQQGRDGRMYPSPSISPYLRHIPPYPAYLAADTAKNPGHTRHQSSVSGGVFTATYEHAWARAHIAETTPEARSAPSPL